MAFAEHLVRVLTPGLGRFMAERAVGLAANKCNKTPGELTSADIDAVRSALRPVLRTLMGAPRTEEILGRFDPEHDGGLP